VEQAAELVAAPHAARQRWRCWRRPPERWALLERAVRTVLVVMPDVGAYNLLDVAAAEDQDPVEALASQAPDPTLGVCLRLRRPHGVRITQTPSDWNTWSKARVNVLSRSRMRKRTGCSRSASVIIRLRACWVAQRSCGFAVTPAKWTRRLPS
jgi:hypothetical protein